MNGWIEGLIEQYGLLAVFIGCFFEGESAAILGGFFSHQGIFDPTQTLLIAWVGSFLGDGVFFVVGRRFTGHRFVERARSTPGFGHALRFMNAYPDLFVITNRYLYGLRIAGGIAVGLSTISAGRFLVLNAIGALVWACLFCGIGYFFGLGVERVLGEAIHSHQRVLLALGIIAACLAAAGIAGHLLMKRRRMRAGNGPSSLE